MQDMVKLIRDLSHRYSPYKIYSDFVEVSAIAFSNAVDKPQFEKREQRYFDIIKGYTKEELNAFPKMLGMLTQHLETGFNDVLGNVYHELEIHNERAGQYFTPYPICQMMAKTQIGPDIKDTIEQQGFVRASEPACGSGALIIALADEMHKQQVNYQQKLHVTAVDLDQCCAHTAYVQFSLLHIPAVVIHGNTLSLEEYSHWYTPAHIMGGWDWKLKRKEFSDTTKELLNLGQSIVEDQNPMVSKLIVKPTMKKGIDPSQLTLF